MRKLFWAGILFAILFSATGCTSSKRAQITSFNSSFRVTVWSGGKAVREYVSKGKVHEETSSDGWYFSDTTTGGLVRVSGTITLEEIR